MIIKKVSIKNFRGFVDEWQDIEINRPLIQLSGKNGAGKTTIAIAIEECLYGMNFKGLKKDELINQQNKKGFGLRVEFYKDDDSYLVEMVRDKGLNVKLIKNNDDISQHTAKGTLALVQKIIGIPYNLFSMLTYLSHTKGIKFLTATPSQRVKELIEIIGVSKTERIRQFIAEDIKSLNERRQEHILIKTSLESKIKTIRKIISELSEIGDISAVEKELDAINEEIRHLSSLDVDARVINTKIIENNRLKEKLKRIKKIEKPKRPQVVDVDDHELFKLKHRMEQIIKQLKLNGNGHCPTCGQPVVIDQDTLKKELNDVKGKISEIEVIKIEINEYKKKINEYKKQLSEQQVIKSMIDSSLPTDAHPTYEFELEVLGRKQKRLQNKIAEYRSKNEQIEQYRSSMNLAEKQLDNELDYISKIDEEIEQLTELKDCLSYKGVTGKVIRIFVDELAKIANKYLFELSIGDISINLELDGDEVLIKYKRKNADIKFNSLSTGQQARVSIAFLLALRQMIKRFTGVECNIVFIDELFSVLDDVGVQMLINVLSNMALNSIVMTQYYEDKRFKTILIDNGVIV